MPAWEHNDERSGASLARPERQVPETPGLAHNVRNGGTNVPEKQRSVNLTRVAEWDDGDIGRKDDYLAAEEPLEIRVGDDPLSVTVRTPGHDVELAAGFLFTDGLIQHREQIMKLEIAEPRDGTNRGNV